MDRLARHYWLWRIVAGGGGGAACLGTPSIVMYAGVPGKLLRLVSMCSEFYSATRKGRWVTAGDCHSHSKIWSAHAHACGRTLSLWWLNAWACGGEITPSLLRPLEPWRDVMMRLGGVSGEDHGGYLEDGQKTSVRPVSWRDGVGWMTGFWTVKLFDS
ncbi:hypothetical protein LX32DRAFT_640508 [Colletotrichum zoysiae]|uniref:Uncharacterized protein n=1 Tax=Colletotrichum zoysiae TaxID=1216348 RepID=A0AAD9HF01_9PEZI|nr:hypothetical protein LX32DRAFT_640508 [Colletotrichum zoysiae]